MNYFNRIKDEAPKTQYRFYYLLVPGTLFPCWLAFKGLTLSADEGGSVSTVTIVGTYFLVNYRCDS